MSDLQEIQDNCRQQGKPVDKVIVVSQWKVLLDIIKTHLTQAGYRISEINGKLLQ